MQKRKSLFSLALIVLVLVLAVATLVACNQDKPKPEYKIVFDNGAGVTTTLTVEEGATIGDYRLPDPSKLGHRFLGWYNSETKFENDMTFYADTTFVAKFERTGYVVTISFEQAGGDDIVAVVDLDDAVLPEDILPDAPILKDKAFKGYYNGDVKAVAGMPITEDVTFVATYYGSEIYTGVFVDEDKKLVAFLEDDFYFGDVLMSREAFKFNTQTGAFEFPKPSFGTGWTLEFVDGKLNLTKITSTGSEVYVMTEAVDEVDYAGAYVKDGSSSMTIYKGGFVKVGDSTPKYQYFKIAADGDGYVLTAVKSAGASVETATVTIDDKGNLTISDIEAGIWIKNGKVEYVISESNSISGKNNET
ncbi:MAG: InlB B-repeat-containing protein, partial [Clostridia bacterium]|nr:InlB B-repeat-containing protein [Clostridia bacterium]